MNSRPLLLGHRGCRGHKYRVSENTLPAFDLALQHGCDGFEFDVRLTADGHPVICHNAKSRRLNVAQSTATRLAHLPGLNEILEHYGDRAFLDIELKVPGLESCLLSAISAFPPRQGYVVSSFLPDVLNDLRKQDESIALGIICETRYELARWPTLPAQYVIVKESLIKAALVHTVHAAGKKLFAWTVNRESSMRRLGNWGVDGIVSDKPDLLVSTFGRSEGNKLRAR